MTVSADKRAAELDRVHAMLVNAAWTGEVCPSNQVIADRMGWAGVASASRAVNHLERAGRIRVERTRVWRIVTIPGTNKRTGWNGMGRNPDPAVAARDEARRSLAKLQGPAEYRQRLASGMTVIKLAIRPGFTGGPARTCQWIEGDPSPGDDCKCGAPSAPGHSWCPDHLVRSVDPEARARVDRQLGIARETARGRAA